jgi:predicted O-linked N-acetylglucosamine transferase (SPINDLY family)
MVSLAGQTYAARFGSSALVNLGLRDLVADSSESYVEIARGLAGNLHRLAELRRSLRGMMRASPLLDAVGFTRNLEAAYRRMWCDWCAAQPK